MNEESNYIGKVNDKLKIMIVDIQTRDVRCASFDLTRYIYIV